MAISRLSAKLAKKSPTSKKNKHGGRGLSAEWLQQQEEEGESEGMSRDTNPTQRPTPAPIRPTSYNSTRGGAPYSNHASDTPHYAHRFGANSMLVHGVQIDFDGVSQILPIQKYYNGSLTFGLKFFFVGTNGFYKIIWYGSDIVTRDADAKIATDRLTATQSVQGK